MNDTKVCSHPYVITLLYHSVRGSCTIFSNLQRENDDTISSMYPEEELYKSMITSLCDHTFV